MARFFDNTTWELETKLWLAYLYGINIIRSKKLHKNYLSQSQESVFIQKRNEHDCLSAMLQHFSLFIGSAT